MFVSRDLIFFRNKKGTLVYNYKWHKGCFVDSKICDKLEEQNQEGLSDLLSEENKKILFENGILYSNENEYENQKYECPEKGFGAIQTVYLHVTQRCNLHCTYCYNAKNLGQIEELSYNEIKNLAVHLKEMGVNQVILTGGEPLLREDISQIARCLKSLKFYVGLLSNGVLLSGQVNILDQIDYAIISIDTLDEKENNRKGLQVRQVTDLLKNLPEKMRKKITIRSVIGKKNMYSWKDVKRFAEQYGMSFISVIQIPNSVAEVKEMPELNCIETVPEKLSLSGEGCGACVTRIAINANGDVYPCQALINPNFLITNIKRKNWLQEFKKSNITNMFINWNINRTARCKECQWRYICGGGCRAIAYNVYGDIFSCTECMCDYKKKEVTERMSAIVEKYL